MHLTVALIALTVSGTFAAPARRPRDGYSLSQRDRDRWNVEVCVIGAGPSGLQAAMSLGRLGRTVALIDSQDYRNNATLHMHDVAGFDGTPPPTFRQLARDQLKPYKTVEYTVDTVLKMVKSERMFYAAGQNSDYICRKVVLATGVKDVLPSIPGIDKVWGTGVYWCPWCDGFEHRGPGQLAVLGLENAGDALAIQKLNPAPETFLMTNGVELTPGSAAVAEIDGNKDLGGQGLKVLQAANLPIDTRPIASIDLSDPNNRESKVIITFLNNIGQKVKQWVNGVVVTTSKPIKSSSLMSDLGMQIDTSKDSEPRANVTSNYQSINVYGVFVVGDAGSTSKNVVHALFSAKRAAVRMVFDLSYEIAKEAAGVPWDEIIR